MNKIKIFKTNNRSMKQTEIEINNWIEEEKIEVIQIDTVQGQTYSISNFPKSYLTEVEFFITILYKENKTLN